MYNIIYYSLWHKKHYFSCRSAVNNLPFLVDSKKIKIKKNNVFKSAVFVCSPSEPF